MTARLLGKVVLPGETSFVPLARAFTKAILRLHDLMAAEDVVLLVVSEFVGNSIRHSDSGKRPEGVVTVTLGTFGPLLRVDVVDAGAADSTPQVRHVDTDSDGGRGLELVEMLVLKWGTYEIATGRVVWADVAVNAVAA